MIAIKRKKYRKSYIHPYDRLSAFDVCTCGTKYSQFDKKCRSCGRKVKH